ncbi:hypothetical protein XBKQ1_1380009 [Xenorhabdus bovienii str. kraussei Quebec]|uniref:DDE domain-containing protein n=1 Tax=Xenorhabdus bovienii str. kraussei Quebec TaxID=1398203 RepID=A0A077PD88_XENBV|nr:hypothetical protein XBKQ1_1380009 [Xenorhabdus bovienii str. kraussei Quebec]
MLTILPYTVGLSGLHHYWVRPFVDINVPWLVARVWMNTDKSKEEAIKIRQNKYLNNRIEQDHRNIKRRIRPMLGFKSFRRAQTILAGIELVSMLRKGQYLQSEDKTLSPAEMFYRLAESYTGS